MRKALILFFLCKMSFAIAQKSVQLEKQPNNFFYIGSNFQVKCDHLFQEDETLTFDNTNVKNLLMLRYKHKNRKLLQKGYVRKFALSSWDFLLNAESEVNSTLGQVAVSDFTQMKFRISAAFNFATKWDRTTFSIGVKNLPFGHQPKIDNFFNFTPTIAKVDFGFNNDIGVFAHLPINDKLDFDGSLTLGGYLKDPFIQSNQLVGSEDSGAGNNGFGIELNPAPYKGTFLMAMRIGSPSYSRQEVGLFSAFGNIVNLEDPSSTSFTVRLGGEYIYKASDHLMFLQQLSVGLYQPNYSMSPNQFVMHSMTGIDYSFRGWFILSLNNSLVRRNNIIDGGSDSYGTLTATAGLVLTPNFQFRMNLQENYLSPEATEKHGLFFQLIFGIGQRP